MKILKHGTLPQEVPFRGTCDQCGAVLEARRHELTITSGKNGLIYDAKCGTPYCGNAVYFHPTGDLQ